MTVAERGRTRERMCGTKRRWQSRQLAANFATLMEWAGRGRMNFYRCHYCRFWHVGHKS